MTQLVEKIRTKYASGLYSNTELVVEFSENLGAFELIKILNYETSPEVCANKRQVILDMPKVQDILTEFHKSLRMEALQIEETGMNDKWRDKEFEGAKKKHRRILYSKLTDYSWVTEDFLSKAYHE